MDSASGQQPSLPVREGESAALPCRIRKSRLGGTALRASIRPGIHAYSLYAPRATSAVLRLLLHGFILAVMSAAAAAAMVR